MNRADRIRKLRALIADPATFEGERDAARAMLARLEAAEPESAEHGGTWGFDGWEPWPGYGPMRAYGPGRPVRFRMSDEPPPDPWDEVVIEVKIEFPFDSPPLSPSEEEDLRASADYPDDGRPWAFR